MTQDDSVYLFITILQQRGYEAYDKFYIALRKSHQGDLAEILFPKLSDPAKCEREISIDVLSPAAQGVSLPDQILNSKLESVHDSIYAFFF